MGKKVSMYLTNVSGVNQSSETKTKIEKDKLKTPKLEYVNDEVQIKTKKAKEDKSNNGKFDVSECLKNFVKGVLSPLAVIKEHPIMAIGMSVLTITACTFVPVIGPVMGIGFGLLSAFQLGKGVYNSAKNYKNGDYDRAEKSFNEIGQGSVGVVMSVLGLKQSAKVAKEAKLMSELNVKSLTQAQREAIALEVKNGSYIDALKEIGSLFTTKTGLKAVIAQFKPSMIKTRVTELADYFKGKRYKTKQEEIENKKSITREEKFKKSAEGIRRASLTDEETEAEITKVYKEVFDKLGISEEQRPQLVIEKGDISLGGEYDIKGHVITLNPEAYKNGVFELDDIIMHEATHSKEALLRAGIPQERADEIVREQLISRIINGENEKILKTGGLLGPEMMDPPKMSQSMRADFAQFAKENLYVKKSLPDMTDKINALLSKHPEFVQQYDSFDDAVKVLNDYCTSHNIRYRAFSGIKINLESNKYEPPRYLDIPQLSGDDLLRAEQSLIDNITSLEGNSRLNETYGLFHSNQAFNQYQFSPEEVLAQKNGNNFLIDNLTAKLNAMKEAGTLTPEQETYMSGLINKAKLIIEYKTKGLEYYKNYTELIHNPDNSKLAETVKLMEKELAALKEQINPEEYEIIKQVIEVPTLFPDIASVDIPASSLAAFDIMNDNIQK